MKSVSKELLLYQFEARIEDHLSKATAFFKHRSAAELLAPAADGGWSMAQCLEHLNSYGRYYLPEIRKRMEQANDAAALSFSSSWLGNYFTRMMEPGAKSKAMKAPKAHIPLRQLDAAQVVAEFTAQQELLLMLVRKARSKDISRIRIPVSIAKFIRLKLGDVFGFLIAHNERHMQQALRHIRTSNQFV